MCVKSVFSVACCSEFESEREVVVLFLIFLMIAYPVFN